ncbi:hypothetical protein LWM68_39310 [Niabella sp. W65]|nr:hypothetical protein [Niabella sp. W65]MCH7368253.1 hypothetical protein [Niabella sp. W65]ULT43859.1 hypothetical protein KRR40_10980 [Niabella sp. I65]
MLKEVLFKDDLERLIGKRPFEEKKALADVVLPTTSGDADVSTLPPYNSSTNTSSTNEE